MNKLFYIFIIVFSYLNISYHIKTLQALNTSEEWISWKILLMELRICNRMKNILIRSSTKKKIPILGLYYFFLMDAFITFLVTTIFQSAQLKKKEIKILLFVFLKLISTKITIVTISLKVRKLESSAFLVGFIN